MAYEQGKMLAQLLINQLQQFAVGLERALADGKVSPMEGVMISMSGLTLASSILSIVPKDSKEARNELFYVLRNGKFVLDEPAVQ